MSRVKQRTIKRAGARPSPARNVVVSLIVLASIVGVAYLSTLLLDAFHNASQELGRQRAMILFAGIGAAIVVTLSVLFYNLVALWRRPGLPPGESRPPAEMSQAEREAEIEQRTSHAREIAEDEHTPPEVREQIHAELGRIEESLTNQKLEIVAFGTISGGKSSLLNALAGREAFKTEVTGGTTVIRNEIGWPGHDQVALVDTPGLGEVRGEAHATIAIQAAMDADVILFVIDQPLRSFEMNALRALGERFQKRIIVCLNKDDWYSAAEREALLGQIREQADGLVLPENIVAVKARQTTRTRIRVMPDGQEIEETVPSEPDIAALTERMLSTVERDGHDLLMANLILRARGLVDSAREKVRATLDQRARQLVNRTTWQAGAQAALDPIPLLDIAVSMGLVVKMVLELARIYHQNVDAAAIRQKVVEMAGILLKTLGVTSVSVGALTLLGPLLKTIPGVGTIAGGAIQGFMQALITRWIGSVFIAYFQSGAQQDFSALARARWGDLTQPGALVQFVQEGIGRIRTKSDGPQQ